MTKSRDGLLRCSWHHLLDGHRPWGSVDVRRDRFGVTRYRLVVYPPGISGAERRRVRVARGWPVWGGAAWILVEIFLTHVLDPWTALAVSTTVVLVLGVTATAAAGTAHSQVRTLTAAVLVGHPDLESSAARDTIQRLGVRLIRADEGLADGSLTAADHEAIWWRVYDEMDARHADSAAVRESDRSA
jgi:hypothetical protein